MRFHVLLTVRDEADIIAQSLRHLLNWADAVYVFDTGSVDQSAEIIQQFAETDKRVSLLKKEPVFFSEKRLRGWIFHQARRHMREGDWFVRADADEFHHVTPPEFVRTRMRRHETVAHHQYYDFRLTNSEVDDWLEGRETIRDRWRPIEERRRWFTLSAYSEPRLCRYRETMEWPETVSFPYNAGYVAVERLPIRHYPHRDPVQLARRCRLRAAMMAEPDNVCNRHWRQADWRHHVLPDTSPELRYWKQGTALPETHLKNHLASPWKRAAQRVVHACFLRWLDSLRPRYSAGSGPGPLPEQLVRQLEAELQSYR